MIIHVGFIKWDWEIPKSSWVSILKYAKIWCILHDMGPDFGKAP
jgi:hypothetical protein